MCHFCSSCRNGTVFQICTVRVTFFSKTTKRRRRLAFLVFAQTPSLVFNSGTIEGNNLRRKTSKSFDCPLNFSLSVHWNCSGLGQFLVYSRNYSTGLLSLFIKYFVRQPMKKKKIFLQIYQSKSQRVVCILGQRYPLMSQILKCCSLRHFWRTTVLLVDVTLLQSNQ